MASHLSFFILFCGLVSSSLGNPIASVFLNLSSNSLEIKMSETATLVHNLTLPDGYESIPGVGMYKLHLRAATWNEARKICHGEAEGGHLAIVNSITEANALKNMLQKSGDVKGASSDDKQAYLGIHDLYKEGEWVTIFDDSLYETSYIVWSDWNGGQPNGGNSQNCGSLLQLDGALNDVECTALMPFFCELSKTYVNHD